MPPPHPSPPRVSRARPLLVASLLVALACPALARAESALRLPVPGVYGEVPARTYDEQGDVVGDATLRTLRLPDGGVRLESLAGIEGGERQRVTAELALTDGGVLKLLSQRSQSHDASGQSLGVMRIDHRRAIGECIPAPGAGGQAESLELPDPDRVANVPMNLLFLPLASGESERVDFQFLICRGGPRLVDATASVAQTRTGPEGRRIVEVRYMLDFGPVLSRLVSPFMPRLSMWFDTSGPSGWVAHTQPLFAKGPTVWVVRSGTTPDGLAPPPGAALSAH